MESYQAIYDAVRSRIYGGDIYSAVRQSINDANLSMYAERAASDISSACENFTLPSVLYRPKLFIDGDQWCALYGDDLQNGVAGFGKSAKLAMLDFDRNWTNVTPKIMKPVGL